MAHIMSKPEVTQMIESFDTVKNAREYVIVRNRRSTTAMGTKTYERRFYMKRDYIMTDAGIPVAIDRPKPRNTVYYDDEYESPMHGSEAEKKAAWMAYNLQFEAPNARTFDFYDGRIKWHNFDDARLNPFVYDGRNNGVVGWVELQAYKMEEVFQRQYDMSRRHIMSEREFNEYLACLDELTEAFKKRLESYWRRYRDKITDCGYWANR